MNFLSFCQSYMLCGVSDSAYCGIYSSATIYILPIVLYFSQMSSYLFADTAQRDLVQYASLLATNSSCLCYSSLNPVPAGMYHSTTQSSSAEATFCTT
jgi:hypothetical protein